METIGTPNNGQILYCNIRKHENLHSFYQMVTGLSWLGKSIVDGFLRIMKTIRLNTIKAIKFILFWGIFKNSKLSFMPHKLLLAILYIALAFLAKGQVVQPNTIITKRGTNSLNADKVGYPIQQTQIVSMVKNLAIIKDTIPLNTKISIKDPILPKKPHYPLIIVGGRRFKGSDFNNLYYDFSNIVGVRVISTKNDSIKLFGRAGRHGIIIFDTKTNIEWITSNAIRRKYFKSLIFWHKKAAFQINGSIINPAPNVYIQKDLIKSVKVINNGFDVYDTIEYHRIINVEVDKVIGCGPPHISY